MRPQYLHIRYRCCPIHRSPGCLSFAVLGNGSGINTDCTSFDSWLGIDFPYDESATIGSDCQIHRPEEVTTSIYGLLRIRSRSTRKRSSLFRSCHQLPTVGKGTE